MSWDLFSKTNQLELKTSFFDTISLVPEADWNQVPHPGNVLLSIPYLRAMEQGLSDRMDFRYLIFYNTQLQPVGLAAIQILNFIDQGNKYGEVMCKLTNKAKHTLLGTVDFKVMVCGNAFACGEHGFAFSPEVPLKEGLANLSNALFKLRRAEAINGNVPLVLMKEFWPQHFEESQGLKKNGFKDFQIDVNMVLAIHPDWNNFDDYLQSMVSKFRTKAKSVMKKSVLVEERDMDVDDIEAYAGSVESLYQKVIERADFNFGQLNAKTFALLKKELNHRFSFKGYFLDNQMIGFRSGFLLDEVFEANYIGVDYTINEDIALYQRMLYNYVKEAIDLGVREIQLGRTSELLKSSLGAQPVPMKLYVKHKNILSNQLIRPILDSISPREYTLRQPFKSSFLKP